MQASTTRRQRRHRDRLSIIAEILGIARYGARKTHLMYRANLGYGQLQDYLRQLTEYGLLARRADEDEMATLYKTTPKGLDYLQKYEVIAEVSKQDMATRVA